MNPNNTSCHQNNQSQACIRHQSPPHMNQPAVEWGKCLALSPLNIEKKLYKLLSLVAQLNLYVHVTSLDLKSDNYRQNQLLSD